MEYLHRSFLRSHGYLHSNNCVIDGRFVLKVTDFHLPMFRQPNVPFDELKSGENLNFKMLVWRAPGMLAVIFRSLNNKYKICHRTST